MARNSNKFRAPPESDKLPVHPWLKKPLNTSSPLPPPPHSYSFVSIRGSTPTPHAPRQDRSRAGKPELHSFVPIRVHSWFKTTHPCPFVVPPPPIYSSLATRYPADVLRRDPSLVQGTGEQPGLHPGIASLPQTVRAVNAATGRPLYTTPSPTNQGEPLMPLFG